MIIYVNQDTNTITSGVNSQQTVPAVYFKRGDAAYVDVIFSSNFSAVSAIPTRQLVFGVKEIGAYDGDYIVYADEFVTSGNRYKLSPNFNTEALNELLGHDSPDPDVASVTLMLEITWSDDAGETWQSSNTINCVIQNDVNKGEEATPVPSQTMLQWLANERPLPLVLSDPPLPPLSGFPSLSAYPDLPYYVKVGGTLTDGTDPVVFSTLKLARIVGEAFAEWTSDGLVDASLDQQVLQISIGDTVRLGIYNGDLELAEVPQWSADFPTVIDSLYPSEAPTLSAISTTTGTPIFTHYPSTTATPGQLAIVNESQVYICMDSQNGFAQINLI